MTRGAPAGCREKEAIEICCRVRRAIHREQRLPRKRSTEYAEGRKHRRPRRRLSVRFSVFPWTKVPTCALPPLASLACFADDPKRSTEYAEGTETPTPLAAAPCSHESVINVLPERNLSAIQSPRKSKSLSHCIFECLIVEASSQAQNHFSILADRYTERGRGVFDCTRDG